MILSFFRKTFERLGSYIGAIGGLLGIGGGVSGTGQNITNPTTAPQLQTGYNNAQNAQTSQQALLQALQAQNGIQNQNQVYGQLQGVANGTGPNPAQAMLNQATGQNVQNQAALAASQRGAGANAGLIARQAAQAGANAQQNAAGQAATLQANQSLNALGQAGNLATNQVGNQIGATTANTQAAQSEQGLLNNANAGTNSVYGGLANTTLQGQQGVVGGLLGGAGTALGLGHAQGGEIESFADGGAATSQPQSTAGAFLSGWAGNNAGQSANKGPMTGSQAIQQGMTQFGKGIGQAFSNNDNSGGNWTDEAAIDSAALAKGGSVGSKLKSGGGVPGKPKVPGNSYVNDTVSAKLSPGEVVIPNSVMQSKDPVRGAAMFVQQVMAKKRMGK